MFRQLYDKGVVYRGYKVMPFSTVCHTLLSNFEAGQNYKDVTDPASEWLNYTAFLCDKFLYNQNE